MGDATLTDVDRLVLQVILASPQHTLYGQKKLHKLLFIAHYPEPFDLKIKRPLWALRFKVFKFGPFASDLYASIGRIEAAGLIEREEREISGNPREAAYLEEEDEGTSAHRVAIFRAIAGAEQELSGADAFDIAVLKEVVEKWGWLTSDQIEALVCNRTGLTPDLKNRYQRMGWDEFEKHSRHERGDVSPTIPESFWRCQQAFFKERASLIKGGHEGQFAAYIDEERVATGADEVDLYKRILDERGRPPDFIGFVSVKGPRVIDAFPS